MNQETLRPSTPFDHAWGLASICAEFVDYLLEPDLLYLFSNALPPPIVVATLLALEIVQQSSQPRDRLHAKQILERVTPEVLLKGMTPEDREKLRRLLDEKSVTY